MDSVAYQASLILGAKGVGSADPATTQWRIYVGQMQDAPDAQIVLIDSPGQSPENKLLLDFPNFQVIVRGDKQAYNEAFGVAANVKDVFLGIDPFDSTGGDHWSGCTMNGDIAFVSYDPNGRPLFSLNFRVLMERAPSTLSNRVSL